MRRRDNGVDESERALQRLYAQIVVTKKKRVVEEGKEDKQEELGMQAFYLHPVLLPRPVAPRDRVLVPRLSVARGCDLPHKRYVSGQVPRR